jgi:hypothetical protein
MAEHSSSTVFFLSRNSKCPKFWFYFKFLFTLHNFPNFRIIKDHLYQFRTSHATLTNVEDSTKQLISLFIRYSVIKYYCSILCDLSCACRLLRLMKPFSHPGNKHLYGRLPVWSISWRFKSKMEEKQNHELFF